MANLDAEVFVAAIVCYVCPPLAVWYRTKGFKKQTIINATMWFITAVLPVLLTLISHEADFPKVRTYLGIVRDLVSLITQAHAYYASFMIKG